MNAGKTADWARRQLDSDTAQEDSVPIDVLCADGPADGRELPYGEVLIGGPMA